MFTPDPAEYNSNLDLKINNTALPMATHAWVMGLTLDPKLTNNTHIHNISVQVHKPQQMIKALTATWWGKQKAILMAIYKAVMSHLHHTLAALKRFFHGSLAAPLPNSEQINLPSSNHTYTTSTPNHIHHHYAPSVTITHTTHIISSTAPTYALHSHPCICGWTPQEWLHCWPDGRRGWLVDRKREDRTCDMLPATCTMLSATCDMLPATWHMRYATCDMHHAICIMRYATCDMRYETCEMRHTIWFRYIIIDTLYLT